MARQYIYHMHGMSKIFPGGKKILENVNLSFYGDAKIGVLGSNGAGKSTLLRIMAGWDQDFQGDAELAKGASVGYLPQEPTLTANRSVRQNVLDGVTEQTALLESFAAVSQRMADAYSEELMAEMTQLQEKIDAASLWDLDSQIDQAMEALRCPPDDADVSSLSGGECRRVALCRLLLEKPELLLLDEPTNHLDAESVAWLEMYLAKYAGAVLVVTHDRYFLDNVTSWILEVDRGRGIPFQGNYSSWLIHKQKRLKQEDRDSAARARGLAQEKAWIDSSPRARQAKSKARIRSYDELWQSAKDAETRGHLQLTIPSGERLGNRVIEADKLSKGFDDRLLFSDLSFRLPPGGIVGVIGPNGAGKTTLFRLITGEEQPDSGAIHIGETVKLGYVNQNRDALQATHTVFEEISEGSDVVQLGKRTVNARGYCAAFNFKGTDQQKKIGQLSGGERNRVHLAKMLKSGSNVLLLDEPTNDLDVATLRALEIALEHFPGCAVIISHDRMFLDRIATHILAFEGDSQVTWFEGNYQAYEADKNKRMGVSHATPGRVRYKRFSRN